MKIIRFTDLDEIPASHEDPKDPGVVKKILFKQGDLFDGKIQMINWATLIPGKTFIRHIHEDMQEVFIMMSDGAIAWVNGKEVTLFKGDVLVVDAKETHQIKNQGTGPINFIVLGIA